MTSPHQFRSRKGRFEPNQHPSEVPLFAKRHMNKQTQRVLHDQDASSVLDMFTRVVRTLTLMIPQALAGFEGSRTFGR
jgi:hypothetical protein